MKTLHLPILAIVIWMNGIVALGQKLTGDQAADDGPVGIFSSRVEYEQFMGGAKQAAYGPNGSAELKAMIPLLNDIALNRPIGWSNGKYGGEGSALGLLSNSKVRQELDMMDDQYAELRKINDDVQKRAADQIRALDFRDRANLVGQIRKIREQAESDLNAVLLPHQMQRLHQIRSQSQLRNRSFVEVITSEPLKTELEITDNQSDELRNAEREIEAELEREIAELREKARQRLLSRLKRSQKEKVEEIFGNVFDFSRGEKAKLPSKKKN